MKKIITGIALMLFSIILVACGARTYEIALITDHGPVNDRSFNQGAWEGVEGYGEEYDVSYKYYRPTENSGTARLEAIRLAVKGGAKIVVAPGSSFDVPIHTAQSEFPEVKFVVLDTDPKPSSSEPGDIKSNTVALHYAEEESGFLLGYAAVKDGFTKLGYMGGLPVPAVKRFGTGYIQGAEYAAVELGLADGSISIDYKHLDGFTNKPENKQLADDWFTNKEIEVIFNAGGGSISNVISSAEEKQDKYVMGANVDQRDLSPRLISSGLKQLKESVYNQLKAFYDNEFPGGSSLRLTSATEGVGLTPDFTRFNVFTQADYDAIYAKLAAKTVTVSNDIEFLVEGKIVELTEQLGLVKVVIKSLS